MMRLAALAGRGTARIHPRHRPGIAAAHPRRTCPAAGRARVHRLARGEQQARRAPQRPDRADRALLRPLAFGARHGPLDRLRRIQSAIRHGDRFPAGPTGRAYRPPHGGQVPGDGRHPADVAKPRAAFPARAQPGNGVKVEILRDGYSIHSRSLNAKYGRFIRRR